MKKTSLLTIVNIRPIALSCVSDNPTVELKIKSFLTGDYETDTFIFERKTLIDLDKSIIDSRLFKQMHNLLVKRKRATFIIKGLPERMGLHGVSREALQGVIITFSLIYGFFVFYSFSPK